MEKRPANYPKIRTFLPLILSIFSILPSSIILGESIIYSTHNPSKTGVYKQIELQRENDALAVPCQNGKMVNHMGKLKFCVNGDWIDAQLWEETGHNITLSDTLSNPALTVSIGTTDPAGRFTVLGDFIAYGNLTFMPLPAEAQGPGTRMFWDPNTGVFRAGSVDGNQWDDNNYKGLTAAFGENNIAWGVASFATGLNNWAGGNDSAIIGGEFNSTNFEYSVVAGGNLNGVHTNSFTGGGNNNAANGSRATIIGGHDNAASGSIILGGALNQSLNESFIAAGNGFNLGDENIADHGSSLIGVGEHTTADNYSAVLASAETSVSGTAHNFATATYNSIIHDLAGSGNVIVGGQNHNLADLISAEYAAIVGGTGAHVNVSNGVSLGGSVHVLHPTNPSTLSFIAGGDGNNGALTAFQISGEDHTLSGNTSFFISGLRNHIENGDYSMAIGGIDNTLDGASYSLIASGINNTISGNYQHNILLGGENVNAQGNFKVSYGRNLTNENNYNFTWGFFDAPTAVEPNENVFYIASGNVGIGTTAPEAKLKVQGTITARLNSSPYPAPSTGPLNYLDHGNQNKEFTQVDDLAETFHTTEEVAVGDVLTSDPSSKLKYRKSRNPYEKTVVGIVSEQPAILFEGSQLQVAPPEGFQKGTRPPVALAGRVLCKVSLESGPIEPGDRLTTSSLEGHAMKAVDLEKSKGAVIGKALEGFNGGPNGEKTGLIIVIVSLQ